MCVRGCVCVSLQRGLRTHGGWAVLVRNTSIGGDPDPASRSVPVASTRTAPTPSTTATATQTTSSGESQTECVCVCGLSRLMRFVFHCGPEGCLAAASGLLSQS